MEVQVLNRQGHSIRAITRMTGISRNTVRAILRGKISDAYGPRPSEPTKLSPFYDFLQQRLSQPGASDLASTVLFREICEQGYDGGITTLRNYVSTIRPKKPPEKLVRFETEPGDQLQIDFVSFRKGHDPLKAFTATLGYSRFTFAEFTDNERVETWVNCLEHAFEAFGGVPKTILCDNPKTIVVERNAYGDGRHRFHQLFYDFAKHYKIRIKPCRPYRAQTKGKVERFHRYLRESFYHPLETRLAPVIVDVHTGNREIHSWLQNVANVRIHATLKERPYDRFLEEKDQLGVLPLSYGGISTRTASNIALVKNIVPIPIESMQHPLAVYDSVLPELSS